MGKTPRGHDILIRIKLAIAEGRYEFTYKARTELHLDGLVEEDAVEGIINADHIDKTMRSRNPLTGDVERLYVMISPNFSGQYLYIKGTLRPVENREIFYVLISAKNAE